MWIMVRPTNPVAPHTATTGRRSATYDSGMAALGSDGEWATDP
jgi:hypothetical protein